MKKIPSIKKNIKAFLTSEEGKITKKNVVELGVSLAVFGVMLGSSASAHGSCWKGDHSSHSSHASHSSHSSHGSHGSHSSHASHSSHGSHGSHSSHSSHASHASHGSHGSHSSHASHGSHGSHSSHASHGSHGSHSSHSSHASHGSHGSHSSHASHASHSSCCPFIILWNGKNFVMENNILPQSEFLGGKKKPVEDLYKLESVPMPEGNKYKIRILEFEQEHSYFSGFELIRVIHPKELKAGIIDNKITFYKNIKKPAKIINSQGKDLTEAINGGNTFKGKIGDNLRIKFQNASSKENILVWKASLRAGYPRVDNMQKAIERLKTPQQLEGFLRKMTSAPWKAPIISCIFLCLFCHSSCKFSIIFYVYPSKGKSKKIGLTHPREIASTGLMNLPLSLMGKKGSFSELGLEWTNTHKLDYIGLAQSADSEEIKKTRIESLKIESLRHSHRKEMSKADLEGGKVELKPVQFLELDFPYKEITLKPQETISYFLKSKGYYKKLN